MDLSHGHADHYDQYVRAMVNDSHSFCGRISYINNKLVNMKIKEFTSPIVRRKFTNDWGALQSSAGGGGHWL